jgi:hypothetical protein
MSTDRNNAHPGRYGSIVFFCDEAGCSEEHDTGYTTWDFAKDNVKLRGWYIMPDGRGGWDHLCPDHGKARYIQQKNQEPREKADLPWLKNK